MAGGANRPLRPRRTLIAAALKEPKCAAGTQKAFLFTDKPGSEAEAIARAAFPKLVTMLGPRPGPDANDGQKNNEYTYGGLMRTIMQQEVGVQAECFISAASSTFSGLVRWRRATLETGAKSPDTEFVYSAR